MRAAEARRAASTITSNSIRFSAVGGQVDWTMNAVPAANILEDLYVDFAVAEATDLDLREPAVCRIARDVFGKLPDLRCPRKLPLSPDPRLHLTLCWLFGRPLEQGIGWGGRIRTCA